MTVQNAIRALAGTLVLAGRLLQSAFTKFCPAEIIMRRLGWFGSSASGRPTRHAEGG